MDDADIRQLLENAIARPDLRVQVERDELHLHVSLVARTGEIADLPVLGNLIAEEIGTFVVDFDALTLWSRSENEDTVRRHATYGLRETPSSEVSTTSLVPKSQLAPELNAPELPLRALADFCFVNNKMLLSAPLPAPHPQVSKAVLTFHSWEPDVQLHVAPVLEEFFRKPDLWWVDRVPLERQAWLYDIATMRRDLLSSVATWLSRYCAHPEVVLREFDRTLKPKQPTAANPAPSISSNNPENAPVRNTSTHPQAIAKSINASLAQHGLAVEADVRETNIALLLKTKQTIEPKLAIALVYKALRHAYVPHLKTATLSGLKRDRRGTWTHSFPLPTAISGETPIDRIGFDRPLLNATAFPAALAIGMLANVLLPFLMLPWHIWIHEFGHATVAWLSGYRALPLPFGWTSVASQKQAWVYVGIVFLLGVFTWQGWREKRRWPIAIGATLMLLQFYMTWLMSDRQFFLWLAFGGIGGEFYLSAFLMICFYFRLPDRWRWDVWRFVVLVVAAATFCQAFWRWHLIDLGIANIPWGTILGGSGDSGGDMNQLNSVFGWSSDRIIQTYRRLGELCVLILAATYGFFSVKMNPHAWFDLAQRGRVWWYERQHAGQRHAR